MRARATDGGSRSAQESIGSSDEATNRRLRPSARRLSTSRAEDMMTLTNRDANRPTHPNAQSAGQYSRSSGGARDRILSTQPLRRLSTSTQALLARLNNWRTITDRWIGGGDTLAILDHIGDANEPIAIPHLMSFGFVRNNEVRSRARSTIHRLFCSVPIESLPLIDESLRQSWSHLDDWYGMRPDDISDLGGSSEADHLYLALMSCHRSGYVRAEALKALSRSSATTTIPFALLRLVDWVREVRFAAETAVRSKLHSAYADAFVGCLSLIGRLATYSRYHPEYTQWVEELLRRPECAGSLRRGIYSESRGVRRHCYKIAAESQSLLTHNVILQATADKDVIVRKWAFKLGATLPIEDHETLMTKAANDPYGPIRRMAIEAALARRTVAPGDLEPFLYDRSASNRHICQRALHERFGQPPADFYRAMIGTHTTAARTATCILGLVETGNRSDAAFIANALENKSTRVRRAAVRAVSVLQLEGYEGVLCRFVSSDAPSVAKAAASALLNMRSVAVGAVWAEALRNPNPMVRPAVLGLLRTVGKWQQLSFYLQAADSDDPVLSGCAISLIARWLARFNTTFVQLGHVDSLALLEMLQSVRSRLSPGLACELEFILRGASK